MKNKMISELARDAGALVTATKDSAGEQVQEARKRVERALEQAKDVYGQVCNKAADGTAAVGELVQKNSWLAIAIGLVAGTALGFVVARRCRKSCPKAKVAKGTE